jgi:hypothetical protein
VRRERRGGRGEEGEERRKEKSNKSPAMFLRDLTFIEDGNSTWNDKKRTQLNMGKISLLGNLYSSLSLATLPNLDRKFKTP